MVRVPLTVEEIKRGQALGVVLREARGARTMVDVAFHAGVSVETLRKIETGRSPSPEFFTVLRICGALGIALDDLVVGRLGDETAEAVAS